MRAVLEARSGLAPEQIDTLCAFGQALIEKNKVMNLTAITEPQAVAELHFLDCIALLQAEDFSGKRVIDVGCGAGFPGVPLKILVPSLEVTLLDSLGKRISWLTETFRRWVCVKFRRFTAGRRSRQSCPASGNPMISLPPGQWRPCPFCASSACRLSRWEDISWP